MSGFRKGNVYVKGIYAGILEECDDGYRFCYDESYLDSPEAYPVSLTLPLASEPYSSKTLFPFFDGIIPEGWLLNVVSRNWKIEPRDRFGLLLVSCKDSIGCVSVEERRQ